MLTNILGYWKFDENGGKPVDSVGAIASVNIGATYAPAVINNGTVLNGASLVTFAENASYKWQTNTAITISLWFNCGAGQDGSRWIQYQNVDSNYEGWSFGLGYGGFVFDIIKENGFSQLRSAAQYTEGQLMNDTWHNVVVSYNGSQNADDILMYIDGSPVGTYDNKSNSSATDISYGGSLMSLGISADQTYYTGIIDEMGIWNRALSPTEALSLYGPGDGFPYPFKNLTGFGTVTGLSTLTL